MNVPIERLSRAEMDARRGTDEEWARWRAARDELERPVLEAKAARARTKHRANRAVADAVRHGKIQKPTHCSACGRETVRREMHAHHDDHTKPLDVRWLCRRCHEAHHRAVVAA
jgi:hypothetical protein